MVQLRQELTDMIDKGGELEPQQKALVRELLQYDPVIMKKMQELKDEAAQTLFRLSQSKKQVAAYNTPYNQESFMFDQRK
ncbi:hypothetical protein J19TS2_18420 [Cohnella xylanilytica]|nr:hypothetical protein J19TS2_18420 [Cohnella xylanilytica]